MTSLQHMALRSSALAAVGITILLAAFEVHAERLSSYLLRQPPLEDAYLLATHWQTPDAKLKQEAMHRSLLAGFSNVPSEMRLDQLDPASMARWSKWLRSIQPKGRIRLPSADARWLQANPKFDPQLAKNHLVEIPKRPTTVTVIQNQGGICQLPHTAGRAALDYAKACEPSVD
jgi:hypothetical protein